MRTLLLIPAAMIGFLVGCNTSPEGGAPGTSNNVKIITPATSKDIKQGTAETVDASIDRGSDFKQDVNLKVNAPDKIDVKLTKDTIKSSDDAKFSMTITVDKTAPLGEHMIRVTATPASGGSATTGEFKVKVTENK